MKANEDKLLAELVDNIMKDAILEPPSSDFTTKVMSSLVITKTNEVFVYKPLIPRSVFILFFGCLVTCVIYLLIDEKPQTNSWFNNTTFNSVYNYQITSLFNFSKITVYSVVSATLMLFIQISFLKKYLDNQLEK